MAANETERQRRLDALLGRALRDTAFRERLIANPREVSREAGLSPEELELVAGGLAIGTSLSPIRIMWCTEKTCNEKGGARVVMFSPDPALSPTIVVQNAPGTEARTEAGTAEGTS
jgi:hypothetical protein